MKLRWIVVPLVCVGALAAAHVYQVIEGIHFKVNGKDVDFGLPPSRFSDKMWEPITYATWRPGTKYVSSSYSDWEEQQSYARRRRANQEALYRKARIAEGNDDRIAALRLYREMHRRGLGDAAFLRGRIELLKAIGDRPVEGLADYLAASALGAKSAPVWPSTSDPTLASFIAYEQAAAIPGDGAKRGRALASVAERYSASPRAPAALIMASRALTQGEKSWYAPSDLRVAHRAVGRLLERYPKSRFAWAAHGERGRIAFVQKRYGEAIRHYEHQVRLAKNDQERRKALTSILLSEDAWGRRDRVASSCLRLMPYAVSRGYVNERLEEAIGFFDANDARRFGDRLRREPELLDEYLEYRVDFTKPTKDLYRFATAPTARSLALARLSSVALMLRDSKRARTYARRALAKTNERDSHALATFTLASLDRRAGHKAAARAGYATLIRKWPKSYLVGGARENLALLNEQLGDLAQALDQYTELGYMEDFAYLIDARMTSGQLAGYIDARPRHPRRPTLIYTLGMRYLRERKWASAERAFNRLSPSRRRDLASMMGHYVDDGLLQDPKATLKALRALDRNVRRARGRSERASALFAMGDYYYRHRNLLLYSPPAWRGARSVAFSYSWNSAVALPEDDRALRRHHEEHEAVSQALRLFRRVVKEYPETSAAPKAAYWGACAARSLSDFANYWRWQDRDGHLLGESVRLMKFAERSKDPLLAKKARKYHRVFRNEYSAYGSAFAKEKGPARRYQGGW